MGGHFSDGRKAPELYRNQGLFIALVAHTGFGPVISSLRGRRPRPLDECAARSKRYYIVCASYL